MYPRKGGAVKLRTSCTAAALSALFGLIGLASESGEAYLEWTAKQAQQVGRAMRVNGQVGKSLDWRVVNTDRSYNYKLRATWLTPEVLRASARLIQLAEGLTNDQARALVSEGEAVAGTVILVEIDPREGSGVIPSGWTARLQPRGHDAPGPRGVVGTNTPALRNVRVLAGTERRDYAYDMFWIVFPLSTPDGEPLFRDDDGEAELVVRIYDKVGRVRWPIPDSIRRRAALSKGGENAN